MKLFKYFYLKFFISLLICLSSCCVIFYIFSLLGNLGEELSFFSILNLSLINTFQIISTIPSMIILLSIILFVVSLRSRNELMILKEYLSTNRLIIIFMPFAIFFTIIEVNKEYVNNLLENSKSILINSSDYTNTKIIINKRLDNTTYTILKEVDLDNYAIKEFHQYEINGDKIIRGEYGNEIDFINNVFVTNQFIKYENDQIENINKNKILSNINKIISNKLIFYENLNKKYFNFNINNLIKVGFFILFYNCVFLILLNKNLIDRKQSYLFSVIFSFILFFYAMIINVIEVNMYNFELKLLSLILIFLIFYKSYKYE